MNERINRIPQQYNPDFDVLVEGPPVTWAEYELYLAFQALEKRILELESPGPNTPQKILRKIQDLINELIRDRLSNNSNLPITVIGKLGDAYNLLQQEIDNEW